MASMEAVDHVQRIVDQWQQERPDLDVSPLRLIGRVSRLANVLGAELVPVFAEAGINDGEYDVLATLRRSGAPYQLTPGELSATTMVTSGAVTKRVDRLQAAGLVTRKVCADDARGRDIALTRKGLRLMERLVDKHVENEHRLVSSLSDAERETLSRLLSKWSAGLDGAR